MSAVDPQMLRAISRVAVVLEELEVTYLVGGSVASSLHGIPRATIDGDLVADLKKRHVGPFVAGLGTGFYVEASAVLQAVMARTSFNVIELEGMIKVDVFAAKREPFTLSELERRVAFDLGGGLPTLFLSSPEDTILAKLDWFRLGGGVSDRQWGDITGVMKVQAERLDLKYLRDMARELKVSDLLERALDDSGLV
jgi:hypothetical protein